jgi:hypothetical protein
MAAADPVPGAQSAADTIADLEAEGCTVAINGYITAPLERCSVTAIHNPDRSGGKPDQSTTVYVDESCPPDHDPDLGFGVGLGVGIGFCRSSHGRTPVQMMSGPTHGLSGLCRECKLILRNESLMPLNTSAQ